MSTVSAASVISEEIEQIREEQSWAFHSTVRTKINEIAELVRQVELLQTRLQQARAGLASLSYEPIDPLKIIGSNA